MAEYKLIAFDMDGTLLDSNKRVREDSLQAIREAVDAGKHVALSTGRSIPELEEYFEILSDVHYIIAASGALLINNPDRKVLFSKPLEEQTVLKLFERTSKFDQMWHLHSDRGYVQKNQMTRMEEFGMGIYRGMFERLVFKASDLAALYKEKKFPVYKFNCYCLTPQQREVMKRALSDLNISIAYSETKSLEVSAKGISKASGLRKLCNYLGIEEYESIAVGDGDNDLEILAEAGLAVAMGNSNSNVLSAADVVVASNDEGGCAQAIRQYLLK